jgi:hypothetical protein
MTDDELVTNLWLTESVKRVNCYGLIIFRQRMPEMQNQWQFRTDQLAGKIFLQLAHAGGSI